MAEPIAEPTDAIPMPTPDDADDMTGVLDDLATAITSMVDTGVPEQHITPLRCKLLEGWTLRDAYGVTADDWAGFLARLKAEIDIFTAALAGAKAELADEGAA